MGYKRWCGVSVIGGGAVGDALVSTISTLDGGTARRSGRGLLVPGRYAYNKGQRAVELSDKARRI